MSDLIEQLRALSAYEHDDASIGEEAAAEIERLTAKVAELEAVLRRIIEAWESKRHSEADMSDLIELLDSLAADLADREAEVESLKAKVAELEAALAKLHEQEGTEEWNEQ